MAQIKEYNSQFGAPAPVQGRQANASDFDTGATAFATAGRAISEVSDVIEKRAAQDDAIEISSQSSKLFVRYSEKLKQMSDSGDITKPDVVSKFNEDFQNEFSAVGDNINTPAGQKLLAEKQATLQEHFYTSSAKQLAEVKGEQAKNKYSETINNYSSALVSAPDNFKQTKDLMESTVLALGLPADQAEKLRQHGNQELAVASAQGWIKLNPAHGKDLVESGEFDKFIDGDKKAALIGHAEQAIRANEAEAERIKRKQKDAKEEAANADMNALLPKIYSNEATTQEILDNQNFTYQQKEHAIGMITRQANGTERNNSGVENDTLKKIMKGEIYSPYQIVNLVGLGLDSKGGTRMLNALKQRSDDSGRKDSDALGAVLKEAEKTLMKNPVLGPDPDGQNRLNAFTTSMYAAFQEGKGKGLTTRQLTDPNDPNYIGRTITNYKANQGEIFDAKMKGLEDQKNPNRYVPNNPLNAQSTMSDLSNAAAAEKARRAAAKVKK